MALQVDLNYLEHTLHRLVQINSINPSLVSGAPGEEEIAVYIAGNLRNLGLNVETFESVPGRPSVLATLRGSGGGRSLMFNAHLDTVGVEGMNEPFSGRLAGPRLYGRGACDMKGSLAASMTALKALVDEEVLLSGDVLLAAVADEEYASVGTIEVLRQVQPTAAIVTEPTELDICLAHKGFTWIQVKTFGRAAHGSRFDLGIDANLRMGRFLARLDRYEQELRARPPHPLVGPPSLHAALLEGGRGLSTYADTCTLKIERRTIPGEDPEAVVSEIRQLAQELAREDGTFQAEVEAFFAREPFEVAAGASIVESIRSAAARLLGRPPAFTGQAPWMDSALLAAAGVETAVIGPSGAGAHAAEEWVDLDSVAQLAGILAETALDYCR